MLLVRFENVSPSTAYTYLLVIVLIQLFSTFGSLNAIELPLELLLDSVNIPKSTDYVRRMTFPLASAENGGGGNSAGSVEMPVDVEDNMDFTTQHSGNGGGVAGNYDDDDIDNNDLTVKSSEMPKWLQMQQEHHHLQMDHVNHNNPSSIQQQKHKHSKHHNNHHQQTSNRQLHHTSPSVSPLRRCSIEISSKIPGICQSMGSIGNACVSGDYIDVFNAECL